MKGDSAGWIEGLFEVAYDDAVVGDSGIADWLNELEDEGLEIKDLSLVVLGQGRSSRTPVFVLVKVNS